MRIFQTEASDFITMDADDFIRAITGRKKEPQAYQGLPQERVLQVFNDPLPVREIIKKYDLSETVVRKIKRKESYKKWLRDY